MNLDLLTVVSARTAVLEKETTATALVDAFYAKIAAEDGAIGAYLTLSKERAYAQASRIDALADKGDALAAAGRGARRGQRRFLPPKDVAHHSRFENPGQLYCALRCDGGSRVWRTQAPLCWARRIATSSPWARPTRTPASIPCTIRAIFRACREAHRGGSAAAVAAGTGSGGAGLRHRRLDSAAGCILRRGRADADLRPRVALRTDCVCLFARSLGPSARR